MEEIEDYKIWYPYEVFYIESMLTITTSAMQDQVILFSLLNKSNIADKNNDAAIIDLSHRIVNHAASIARYFWPITREKLHKIRGQRLREAFEIKESNKIKNRNLRNYLEHFDEKLDTYLSKIIVGTIFPIYVGVRQTSDQPLHFFRAYFLNEHIFKALDVEYQIMPIIDELIRIHNLLVKFNSNGGRLPVTP